MKDAWHTRHWRDKLRLWFMPTGWRPADVEEKHPLPRCLPDSQEKFDPLPTNSALALSVLAVHLFLMGFTVWFMLQGMTLTFVLALAHFLPLGGGLWINSRLLEQRKGGVTLSTLFWLFCALLPWWVDGWLLPQTLSSLLFLGLAMLMPAVSLLTRSHPDQPAQH